MDREAILNWARIEERERKERIRRTIFYWVGIGFLILSFFFFLFGIWLWNAKLGLTAFVFLVSATITSILHECL